MQSWSITGETKKKNNRQNFTMPFAGAKQILLRNLQIQTQGRSARSSCCEKQLCPVPTCMRARSCTQPVIKQNCVSSDHSFQAVFRSPLKLNCLQLRDTVFDSLNSRSYQGSSARLEFKFPYKFLIQRVK